MAATSPHFKTSKPIEVDATWTRWGVFFLNRCASAWTKNLNVVLLLGFQRQLLVAVGVHVVLYSRSVSFQVIAQPGSER